MTPALQIATHPSGPALTPHQKRFNTLIGQIEQAHLHLATWHDGIAAYRQSHAQVLRPIITQVLAARQQWAVALDAEFDRRKWSRQEREILSELICDACAELIDAQVDNLQAKALYNKHAKVDFQTERDALASTMKGLAPRASGHMSEDDPYPVTEEELFERTEQQRHERAQRFEDERSARAAARRQSAAKKRQEAQEQLSVQSVRDIYRKLASALHPDREPDEQMREAKTALMKKVNQAYAAHDLFALLELQWQIEQIDAYQMANASAERLSHYNKILTAQLRQLEQAAHAAKLVFMDELGLPESWSMSASRLDKLVDDQKRDLRAELAQHKRDMRMLSDQAATRRWLKQHWVMEREADSVFDEYDQD